MSSPVGYQTRHGKEPNKKREQKMHNSFEKPSLTVRKASISEDAFNQLFREARTHSAWLPDPVPVELLRKAYELARVGPTSANSSPARFVFLTTPGAKARVQPALAPGNVEKTMAAPVTAIIAWDTQLHETLPRLFPQFDMRSYFVGNQALIDETAFRNSSLQASILHYGGTSFGVGLRTDVPFRRRQTQRRVFFRRQVEGQPPLQSRLRRQNQALPTQSSAQF